MFITHARHHKVVLHFNHRIVISSYWYQNVRLIFLLWFSEKSDKQFNEWKVLNRWIKQIITNESNIDVHLLIFIMRLIGLLIFLFCTNKQCQLALFYSNDWVITENQQFYVSVWLKYIIFLTASNKTAHICTL